MSNAAYSLSSLKTLGLATAVSLMAPNCALADVMTPEAPTSKSQKEKVDYTGEELFRGIFFFEGRVATMIPAFDSYRALIQKGTTQYPDMMTRRADTIDALVKAVRGIYPTYFIELKQAIQSENPERIKGAIRKGTTLNEAAALATLTSSEAKQAFLARRQVIQTLNLAQYNFKREKDIQRFMDDTKQALREAGYQAAPSRVGQSSSVVISESIHAWFDQLADQSAPSQKEAAKLIDELSANLN